MKRWRSDAAVRPVAVEIDSLALFRHGEERSDVAIQGPVRAALDGHALTGLAMTGQCFGPLVSDLDEVQALPVLLDIIAWRSADLPWRVEPVTKLQPEPASTPAIV